MTLTEVKIQYVNIPKGSRVFAASDLHAHGAWLKTLLDKVGFCDDDFLFLVGDYLERGSENLKTLRYVMELCRKANVYATLGNLDIWSMSVFSRTPEEIKARIESMVPAYGSSLFSDMCDDAGLPYGTLEEIKYARGCLAEQYQPELDFLRKLPTIIDTPYYTFVHGGIPTKELHSLDMSDARPYLKNDAFIDQKICFDKWLIVGHWPATLYSTNAVNLNPHISYEQKIIDIDGGSGVKRDGQANLLVIPKAGEDVFDWHSCDDFPRFRALDAQAQSKVSANIHYADPWLEVQERCGELARVRRLSDGYTLWLPESRVKETDGKARIWGDFSDFRPEIRPGDTVSLIWKDAIGTYIKKDGICGYYDGRLEPLKA